MSEDKSVCPRCGSPCTWKVVEGRDGTWRGWSCKRCTPNLFKCPECKDGWMEDDALGSFFEPAWGWTCGTCDFEIEE